MRNLILLTAAFCFALVGSAFAFHDAGVAHCNGCHTMHNSEDGVLVDPDEPDGNAWLLKDETPSDVCLSCHGDHLGSVFVDDPMVPPRLIGAGNFTYLLEDNLNDGHNGGSGDSVWVGPDPGDSIWVWSNPIPGDAAGHSIVAPSMGVYADATLGSSPGGSYPASQMGCSSCHDPHGNTNFRMLYGITTIQDGLFSFTNDAPEAMGMGIFGGPGESNTSHTKYISGMSDWCGNCHGDFHDNNTQLIHRSGGNIGGTIATTYGLYNGTSDLTGGNPSTSYLAEVPFEDDIWTDTLTVPNAGPSASSTIMCLTCHRAHASSAPNAGRWDFSVTLLDEDGHESGSYALPNPFDADQRSLCNKCHAKDINDHVSIP